MEKALAEEISNLRPPRVSHAVLLNWLDYEYDSYICYGCFGCDSGNDFCRGSVYEGLRIVGVQPDRIAKDIFGKTISDDLTSFLIEKFDLDSLDSYWVKGNMDYYGETILMGVEDAVSEAIINWFYALPHARTKILEGWDADVGNSAGVSATEGLSILMSNDRYTLPEDKIVPGGFSSAKMFKIPMSSILIPNEKYFATAVGEPPIETMDPDPVAGVVVPGNINQWVLVEGYERFLQGRDSGGEDYWAWFVVPFWD